MRRAAPVILAMLLVVGLVALFLSRSEEPVDVPKTEPAPVVRREVPTPEPERVVTPSVDLRPDSGIPLGAEFGIIDEEDDADRQAEEDRVDAELALPPKIMRRYGEWDSFRMVPDRIGRIEDLKLRPVERTSVLAVQLAWATQSEAASMAVGEYRLGRNTEAETEAKLEAARVAFRTSAMAELDLDDAQFDEVFGMGTLR